LTARNWIISAQKGQGLVCGGLVVTVSIGYISEMSGGFGQIRCRRALKKFSKKCKISLTKCKATFTLHIEYLKWFGM
jgi:hypothetical protein